METVTPTSAPLKPPLGLPKGSIRAILALSIFGSLMASLILARELPETTFWYLWMVNYAVLGYYFASRQKSGPANVPSPVATSQPLYLPRGTVRWIIILTFLGTLGYFIYKWTTTKQAIWDDKAVFPMMSLLGFFVGRVVEFLFRGRTGSSSGFWKFLRNGQALLALMAAAMIVLTIPVGVDVPNKAEVQRSCFLFVFFYFGSR